MAVHPGPSTIPKTQKDTKKDPVSLAWIDLTERVSVCGWKEALSEEIMNIRRMFQISLLILSILSIYYSAMVLQQWLQSGYKDDIEDIYDPPKMPFSNVTICAQVALNQSFIKSNIFIPEKVLQKTIRDTGLSENDLYRQLALYFSFISRPKFFDSKLLAFFSRVIQKNHHLEDYTGFMEDASLQCQSLFRKCWFNEKEFDCCQKAVKSLDDDGMCYLLALNSDSDNAYQSNSTYHQTRAGPAGGLTVEASLFLDDFPWLEDDRDNGFRIYVNPVPYSGIQSPLGAPSGAETFIKVIPSMHNLSINCTPHGKLDKRQSFMYYDPDGADCAMEGVEQLCFEYISCMVAWYLYRPNASIVCNPVNANLGAFMMSRSDAESFFKSLVAKSVGAGADRLNQVLDKFQERYRKTFSESAFCKKHCSRWTYDSTSSFVDLDQPEEKATKNRMFSRIHVYYGDLSYRKYIQVKEYSSYLAFCDFGNVIGLYWGMSIVTFMHVIYYVPRYFYIRRQYRPPKPVTAVH